MSIHVVQLQTRLNSKLQVMEIAHKRVCQALEAQAKPQTSSMQDSLASAGADSKESSGRAAADSKQSSRSAEEFSTDATTTKRFCASLFNLIQVKHHNLSRNLILVCFVM